MTLFFVAVLTTISENLSHGVHVLDRMEGSDTEEIIHISTDESLEFCDSCSTFEQVIVKAVHLWLEENAADLLANMFVPKKISKKRKLSKISK